MISGSSAAAEQAGGAGRRSEFFSVWRALLWSEWYAHSRLVLILLAVWLVSVWLLPLFMHPCWILLLGGLYALLAGPMYGGGDLLDGSEEFCFALPPTRGERYIARATVGGGTLLIITGMNLAVLGLDVPQVLAGLYVKAGLVQPWSTMRLGLLSGLVLALPLAVFSIAFVVSTLAHSRVLVLLAWFWGALGALAVLQVGIWYESLVWDKLNGYFSCPLLIAVAIATLGFGLVRFRRKEVGGPSAPIVLPGYWWLWVLLFVVGLGLALALLSSLATQFPRILLPEPDTIRAR